MEEEKIEQGHKSANTVSDIVDISIRETSMPKQTR